MQNPLHRRNRIWLQRNSWMHLSGRRWNRLSACGRKRKINSSETGAILEQAFCRQAKSFPAWELAQQTKAFPNHVLPYYAEDTRTLKLQELRERYAEPVAPPEPYLVTAEQLDAFVRQTVEQIVSVWKKKENQFS